MTCVRESWSLIKDDGGILIAVENKVLQVVYTDQFSNLEIQVYERRINESVNDLYSKPDHYPSSG